MRRLPPPPSADSSRSDEGGGREPPSSKAGTEALGASVIRGTLWTFVGNILPQVYLLVSSVFLARVLGADGLGQLTFITFTAGTLGILLTLGFPTSIGRYVAESIGAGREDEVAGLNRWAWRFGTGIAMLAAGLIWLVALFGGEPQAAWFLAGISSACAVLHQIPSVVLVGMRRWRDAMIVGTTTGLISVVVRVSLLLAGGGIVSMVAVDASIGLINVVFTSFLARRAVRGLSARPKYEPALIRRMTRFAVAASLGVVITWIVFRRSEVFFLQYFSTPDQIAIYSIPFTAVATLLYIPRSITFVLGPTFTTLFGAGEATRIRDGFARSVRLVTTLSLALTGYALVAGPAAVMVFYGPEFERSGLVMRILLLSLPLVPAMVIGSNLLSSVDKQWLATGAIAFAAVVNIALDVVLIAKYDAIGAAVANSCAQVAGSLPLLYLARKAVGGLDLGGFVLVRATFVSLAAAACAGAALAAVSALPGMIGLAVATVAFALAFLALSCVVPILVPSDAGALADRVGGRMGGRPRLLLRRMSRGAYLAGRKG